MSILDTQAEEFERLKKANSPWFSLDDGESSEVVLRSMKAATKTDANTGVTSAVMVIDFDVETEEGMKIKKWNTSSSKVVQLMAEKGIDIGSSFTITKHGESFQTTYEITNVVNKVKNTSSTPLANPGAISNAGAQPTTPETNSATLTKAPETKA